MWRLAKSKVPARSWLHSSAAVAYPWTRRLVDGQPRIVTAKTLVKFTANFERNLYVIDTFLLQAEAPNAFDALLD
jgi:hypothetical protein